MSRSHRRRSPLINADAINLARVAVEEIIEPGDGDVGKHLGVAHVSRNVATHRFQSHVPGYSGWEWNVVLACADGAHDATVNEVVLVPTPNGDALQAPEWVPYADRVRPGDLRPGDLMPPPPHDERLTEYRRHSVVPSEFVDEEQKNYLTRAGLEEATERWIKGPYGPRSAHARRAQLSCHSCAFFLPFGQPLGEDFGACVNEYSADGHVVHSTYGCGAHSQTEVKELDHRGEPATATVLYDDEKAIF